MQLQPHMVQKLSQRSIFRLAESSWPVVVEQEVVGHEAVHVDSAGEAKAGFQFQSVEEGD